MFGGIDSGRYWNKAGVPGCLNQMLCAESLSAIGYGRGYAIAAFQLAQLIWTEA